MIRRHTARLRHHPAVAILLGCLAAAGAPLALAAPKTVCTITINSADEKQALQRHLPGDQYRLVELVQRGQPDWLESACQQGVTCDALVISGHFDDGSEFYTDRFDDREFLTMHELQRASCSASCSGLFAQLKEVYLFGCNTLKSDPRHTSSPEIARDLIRAGRSPADAERASALLSERYGQSNRDRLRHVFKGVPVLYGFSSAAPLGHTAGPLLERYLQAAPTGEVAGGRTSSRLLALFGPSSMVAVEGLRETDPHAGFRQDMCALADDRPTDADKLAFMHALLKKRNMGEVRMFLDHLERFVGTLGPARRRDPAVAAALAAIESDRGTRERYMQFARDADEAGINLRMLALARQVGWLSPAQEQAEFLRMLADRMARGRVGRTEVDLVCGSPQGRDGGLAARLQATGAARPDDAAHAAVLACLGSTQAHARAIRALIGPRADDVAIAQVYLRHRPLAGVEELRAITSGIARMTVVGLQVQALQALARQRVADPQSLQEIAGLFPQVRSLEVQRAIAGILIRSDTTMLPRAGLARTLSQHRIRSPDGQDVIDMLIRLLQSAA